MRLPTNVLKPIPPKLRIPHSAGKVIWRGNSASPELDAVIPKAVAAAQAEPATQKSEAPQP